MSDSFDNEILDLLVETREVYIETRRDGDSPVHRTIIWVVIVDGEVFVRSVRGENGRWYREISSNPEAALHADGKRIPMRATPATEVRTVGAVSEAYRKKYGKISPGSTASMVRPEVLSTTLKLSPA
jgi:hypothetical protein